MPPTAALIDCAPAVLSQSALSGQCDIREPIQQQDLLSTLGAIPCDGDQTCMFLFRGVYIC